MTGTDSADSEMLQAAWTLTRTELRTTVRHVSGSARRTVSNGLLLLLAVGVPLLMWGQTTAFGRSAASGPLPIGTLAASYLGVCSAGGYLGFVGGFNQSRVGVVGPLIRTSIPPKSVSIGRFATRTLEGLAVLGPAGLVLLAGVGVGAGGPLVPTLTGIGAVPILALGVVAGRLAGDITRYGNERLQVSLWIRAGLYIAILIVIFVGTQAALRVLVEPESGFDPRSIGALLPGEPVQAYAALAFAPLGASAEVLGGLVFGAIVVGVTLGFVAAIRLETHMLVSDIGADSGGPSIEGTDSVPFGFDRTPSGRIAWRYLLRTRRDPRTLAHLMPVLFGALGMSGTAIDDPNTLLVIGPPGTVIAGAILAGGAFCLNPLGDDQDQLPLLLTSVPTVGPLLRGRMLGGIAIGLGVAIGVGAPLGLVAYSPAFVLGQSLLAVFLTLVAAGTALGLGAAVPKFERREYMSVERAHPSMAITFAFFIGGMVVGAIGFVLLWVALTETLLGGSLFLLGYGVVLGLVAAAGYWYADRRFRALSLDHP